MSECKNDNNSVRVTGEERKHPAVRSLARACITLARLRLEQEAQAEHAATPQQAASAADAEASDAAEEASA